MCGKHESKVHLCGERSSGDAGAASVMRRVHSTRGVIETHAKYRRRSGESDERRDTTYVQNQTLGEEPVG